MTNEATQQRNEIDTHPAGEDLDILIAKEVFKIEGIKYTPTWGWGYLEGEPVTFSRLPRYSTVEADAFRVVRHFTEREEPYIFEMAKPENSSWMVAFSLGFVSEGKADTPSLAICRAALRAIRQDVSLPEVVK